MTLNLQYKIFLYFLNNQKENYPNFTCLNKADNQLPIQMLHHSKGQTFKLQFLYIFKKQNQYNPLSKTENLHKKMHCRSKWSKLLQLLKWKYLCEQNGRSQRASLYLNRRPFYIYLSLSFLFFPSSTKQTKRTDSLNPSLLKKEKWDLDKKIWMMREYDMRERPAGCA